MSETFQFELPLVQASQAQKHVTVNEALARLDAVAQMQVFADDLPSPPDSAVDGEAYVVGAGATDDWTGRDSEFAVYSNGGWVFLTPKIGWRAWNISAAVEIMFDGVAWVRSAFLISGGGAATVQKVVEIDHTVAAAASSITSDIIPSHAQVIGVTARVITEITGSGVSSWSLGVSGDEARYGNSLGLSLNSYGLGIASSPQTYWVDTPLQITADAGTFSTGGIRLVVHFIELVAPRPV